MSINNPIQDVIDRIKSDLEKLEQEVAPTRSDLADPNTKQQKAKELDAFFVDRINLFKDADFGVGLPENNNWEYPVLERRKIALLHLFAEAQERFGDKYPELDIADQLMRFNGPLATLSFQTLDQDYYAELAMAIWMLDHLKANDVYEEALRYFPTSRREIDSVYLPYLSDSVHHDDELKCMLYLIRNRNRGMKGYNKNRAFCDEADTGLTKSDTNEPTQDRKNFDAVMSLIDEEVIRSVQQDLIDLIWEFFDSLLSIMNSFNGDRLQLKKKMIRSLKEQLSGYEDMQVKAPAAPMVGQNSDLFDPVVTRSASAPEVPPELKQRAILLDDLANEIGKRNDMIETLYLYVMLIPDWINGNTPEAIDMQVYLGVRTPIIRNPYSICFAFLSLLDAHSDYAWLYNLSYDILAFACQCLPWADSNVVDPDGNAPEIRIDYPYLKSLIEKDPDWHEDKSTDTIYELNIPSPVLKNHRTMTSIAKLAFLTSGLIPPRSGESISFTNSLLSETELAPEARSALYNYFALAHAVNQKDPAFQIAEEEQVEDDSAQEQQDIESRTEEIKKLKAQIRRLKDMVNQVKHRNKDLTAELDKTKKTADATTAELAELRSMIRESCDTEEMNVTTVEFPYSVKQRTVIVGGHESWVKAIKPLLNNVRFIGASEQPNSGVILNAEVVWMQTNAMAHSGFYKIIDIIRKNDIKVRYFKYASAEKCAEQLALEETES